MASMGKLRLLPNGLLGMRQGPACDRFQRVGDAGDSTVAGGASAASKDSFAWEIFDVASGEGLGIRLSQVM